MTFEECREYVLFVRLKACPLTGPLPPLEKITRADEDTRSLWASSMRGGATLSVAMKRNSAEMHALWLWACETKVREARDVVDSARAQSPPRPAKAARISVTPSSDRKPKYASTARSGAAFCTAWNKGGCKDGQTCPQKKVHACNLILTNSQICGGAHRCSEGHSGDAPE